MSFLFSMRVGRGGYISWKMNANDFSTLLGSMEEERNLSASKHKNDYEEKAIYFDSDYLYFPGRVLEEMYLNERAQIPLAYW